MNASNQVEDVTIRRASGKAARFVTGDEGSGLLEQVQRREALLEQIRPKLAALGFTDDEITVLLDQ